MKKGLKFFLIIVCLVGVVYLSGPSPSSPILSRELPKVPTNAIALEQYIAANESVHKLKPNNHARIVWDNESTKNTTEYAIVYLHGFSACQEEGNPVHRTIAKEFGCNLYLSRLAEHGIDTTEQLLNLTADKLWESAEQGLAIGKQLGKKIILMGTSTGATLALQLAAAYPNEVAALILYSPNIAINDPAAFLLNNPWGLQIARLVKKGNTITPLDSSENYMKYWNSPYRLEAAVELQELLECTMNENTFAQIKQPVLTLYYYKDELNQDRVVKVSAIKMMMEQLATPATKKREIAMPNTGDHVLASPIRSKDIEGVKKETELFLKQIMEMDFKSTLN